MGESSKFQKNWTLEIHILKLAGSLQKWIISSLNDCVKIWKHIKKAIIICLIQHFEKVSLKILYSGLILKTFTHADVISTKISWACSKGEHFLFIQENIHCLGLLFSPFQVFKVAFFRIVCLNLAQRNLHLIFKTMTVFLVNIICYLFLSTPNYQYHKLLIFEYPKLSISYVTYIWVPQTITHMFGLGRFVKGSVQQVGVLEIVTYIRFFLQGSRWNVFPIIHISHFLQYGRYWHEQLFLPTVKPVLCSHSKIDKTKILMINVSSMKVESIAECSPWSILQYFWPALSNNLSWKPILVFFLSGRLRQVLL